MLKNFICRIIASKRIIFGLCIFMGLSISSMQIVTAAPNDSPGKDENTHYALEYSLPEPFPAYHWPEGLVEYSFKFSEGCELDDNERYNDFVIEEGGFWREEPIYIRLAGVLLEKRGDNHAGYVDPGQRFIPVATWAEIESYEEADSFSRQCEITFSANGVDYPLIEKVIYSENGEVVQQDQADEGASEEAPFENVDVHFTSSTFTLNRWSAGPLNYTIYGLGACEAEYSNAVEISYDAEIKLGVAYFRVGGVHSKSGEGPLPSLHPDQTTAAQVTLQNINNQSDLNDILDTCRYEIEFGNETYPLDIQEVVRVGEEAVAVQEPAPTISITVQEPSATPTPLIEILECDSSVSDCDGVDDANIHDVDISFNDHSGKITFDVDVSYLAMTHSLKLVLTFLDENGDFLFPEENPNQDFSNRVAVEQTILTSYSESWRNMTAQIQITYDQFYEGNRSYTPFISAISDQKFYDQYQTSPIFVDTVMVRASQGGAIQINIECNSNTDSDCDGLDNEEELWVAQNFAPIYLFDRDENEHKKLETPDGDKRMEGFVSGVEEFENVAFLYQVSPVNCIEDGKLYGDTNDKYNPSGVLLTIVMLNDYDYVPLKQKDDLVDFVTGPGEHDTFAHYGDTERTQICLSRKANGSLGTSDKGAEFYPHSSNRAGEKWVFRPVAVSIKRHGHDFNYSPNEIPFWGRTSGYLSHPYFWVSEGKHGLYVSHDECESYPDAFDVTLLEGGFFAYLGWDEDCSGSDFDEIHPTITSEFNVGEYRTELIINTSERPNLANAFPKGEWVWALDDHERYDRNKDYFCGGNDVENPRDKHSIVNFGSGDLLSGLLSAVSPFADPLDMVDIFPEINLKEGIYEQAICAGGLHGKWYVPAIYCLDLYANIPGKCD